MLLIALWRPIMSLKELLNVHDTAVAISGCRHGSYVAAGTALCYKKLTEHPETVLPAQLLL